MPAGTRPWSLGRPAVLIGVFTPHVTAVFTEVTAAELPQGEAGPGLELESDSYAPASKCQASFWRAPAIAGLYLSGRRLPRRECRSPHASWSRRPRPISAKASALVSLSVNELYVDDPDKDSGGKIDVSLNISLPNLHCDREYSQQDSPRPPVPLHPPTHPHPV